MSAFRPQNAGSDLRTQPCEAARLDTQASQPLDVERCWECLVHQVAGFGPRVKGRLETAHPMRYWSVACVLQLLFGVPPTFVAEAAPLRGNDELTRLVVHTEGDSAVPLLVDGRHAFNLIVAFTCEWDNRKAYLAVRKAHFHVFSVESFDPLYRYEYVDGMQSRLPTAHLHVHAHRDEIVFQLFRSDKKNGPSM